MEVLWYSNSDDCLIPEYWAHKHTRT